MKTTFIATVLNEENDIKSFADSIKNQSTKPGEIIIVDAGSRDRTKKILSHYKNFKILTKKGNRSIGRNFGISKAKGEIIIVSDAGCTLEKNFIRNITRPFANSNVDVVSGFYYPVANTIFEKCVSTYTCVMPDRLDKNNFLPSSRSIAFKKKAWNKVGGYPEYLDTCEDLVFARNLKRTGFKFKFQKNAFVNWQQQDSFLKAFLQFYSYAKGDGKAMYIRPQVPLIFARYLAGLLLVVILIYQKNLLILLLLIFLIIAYSIWSIQKNYHYVKKISALFYLPLLQYTSDIAVIIGMCIGIAQRFKGQGE